MGDCVGELFYGVKLTRRQAERVAKKLGLREDGDEESPSGNSVGHGCEVNEPYETDEVFFMVKDSHKEAYNGSRALTPNDTTTQKAWDCQLSAACSDHNIPFNTSAHDRPGWFLVGRYN